MNAHWIWDSAEAHPRNSWTCFRKSFELHGAPEEAELSLFADSRYVLWVNGARVGQGPVRGWPEQPRYDTWPVTRLLRKGANVVAVLVHHLGCSTMQHIEAEACLAATLGLTVHGRRIAIDTDDSWKTAAHPGYARNAIRNYPQQGWSEIYDAGAMEDAWTEPGFDDLGWKPSFPLPASSPAWKRSLEPRDIPHLREDPVYAERIHGSRLIRTHGTALTIDLRPAISPPEDMDMNKKTFVGAVATIVTAAEEVSCDIEFPWWRMILLRGSVRIDGIHYRLEPDGRKLSVRLKKGPNLLVMDVSGITHSLGAYFRFATDVALSFAAPLHPGHRFDFIGPFDYRTIISIGIPSPDRPDTFSWDHDALFTRLADNPLASVGDLARISAWLSPVPEACVCDANLYDSAVHRTTLCEVDPAADAAGMILANDESTVIPPEPEGLREVVVDFGRELSGYLEFALEAPKGAVLDFYGIECIRDDGSIEHTDGIQCTLRYTAREGWQSYRSPTRRGLRYLLITFRGLSRPLRFQRLLLHNSSYAAEKVGRFDCADRTLTRIWEISRDTDLLCMEDTFVDCPCYEQTFWVGDARGEALVAHYAFGAYDFARRAWRLVARSLERSPITESQVPSGWQNVLTTWSMFWMMACREYVEHSGDERFMAEIYPSLRKNVGALLDRVNADDLLSIEAWNMLDWAPMDTPDRGVVTHLNAELARVLRELSWMARRLGRDSDAPEMEEASARITAAVNRNFWNDRAKAYIDSIHEDGAPSATISMQTNVMVYICDCAEGARKKAIERYLAKPPASFVQIGSPFVTFFYYEALAKAGMTAALLADIRDKYGMMLDAGATSCWETFPGFEKGRLTRSHCHGWSAAPAYFFGAHVLGVRPLEPGFSRTLVAPSLGDLEWAKGSVPTPRGRIDIRCERAGAGAQAGAAAGVRVSVRAPRGVELVPGPGVTLA
jgi:alpha-L-rhamnosidase